MLGHLRLRRWRRVLRVGQALGRPAALRGIAGLQPLPRPAGCPCMTGRPIDSLSCAPAPPALAGTQDLVIDMFEAPPEPMPRKKPQKA